MRANRYASPAKCAGFMVTGGLTAGRLDEAQIAQGE
jgi:hypothetical protein